MEPAMNQTSIDWNAPSPADRQTFPPQIVFEAGLRHHHIANTAYPIHHQTTVRPYRVPRPSVEATTRAAWHGIDRLGLYVHVPFCAARCRYCEYTVVHHSENNAENAYFDALLREFALYRRTLDTTRKTLIGFDIGGGTPALSSVANLRRMVGAAREAFRFKPGMVISIETTPVIADRQPSKMRALKGLGIDRISMGVQTTHFRLARSLGREYEGPGMLHNAVRNIRRAGFDRFNIDLMYGFADQSPETWRVTVAQTIALGPEYVTLYQMRYKGTRIRDQAARVTRRMTNELEAIARDLLLAAGYAGSPGKNTYSRLPGDVGTSDYLTQRVVKGTPYLGLGLGAQSLSHHTLAYNLGAAAKALKPYLRAVEAGRLPVQDLYHLPLEAAMAKMIAVSFYFGQIHREHFFTKFGVRLEEKFQREAAFLRQHGLMQDAGPFLRLTPKGAEHFNGVVALFFSGAVQDYLIHLKSSFATPAESATLREAA
jgi:oxygen-independent coproporphyrinogen-3 oxidase